MQDITSFVADLFTIGASGLAMYIFFVKGKDVAAAFRLLSNYAYQTTLSELRDKLERLNEYNAADDADNQEIVNVFHEIFGQINGHPKLRIHFSEFILKVEKATTGKKRLTEPQKRSLVSELRESIKHLNIGSINDIMGDN